MTRLMFGDRLREFSDALRDGTDSELGGWHLGNDQIDAMEEKFRLELLAFLATMKKTRNKSTRSDQVRAAARILAISMVEFSQIALDRRLDIEQAVEQREIIKGRGYWLS